MRVKSIHIPCALISALVIFGFGCTKDGVIVQTPLLETSSISSITPNTANGGGNIISDAGVPIMERGICWSTTQLPTVLDHKTSDGKVLGSFKSSIAGLVYKTTYYVRAYVSNANGTFYGNTVSFATPNCQESFVANRVTDPDKVAQLLVGIWERYHDYYQYTSQSSPGIFDHSSTHTYYCESRVKLVFTDELLINSISELGVVTPLGTYTLNYSPDGFLQVVTTSGRIDGKINMFDDGFHLTIWNWANVVAGKIYDTQGNEYVKVK